MDSIQTNLSNMDVDEEVALDHGVDMCDAKSGTGTGAFLLQNYSMESSQRGIAIIFYHQEEAAASHANGDRAAEPLPADVQALTKALQFVGFKEPELHKNLSASSIENTMKKLVERLNAEAGPDSIDSIDCLFVAFLNGGNGRLIQRPGHPDDVTNVYMAGARFQGQVLSASRWKTQSISGPGNIQ